MPQWGNVRWWFVVSAWWCRATLSCACIFRRSLYIQEQQWFRFRPPLRMCIRGEVEAADVATPAQLAQAAARVGCRFRNMASIDDWMWDLDDGLRIDPVLGAHLDVALASEGRDSTAGGFWLFPDGADLTTQILAELEASTAATARIGPAIEDTPRQSDGRAPSAEQAGSAAGTAHSGSIHVNLEHVVETPLANPQTLPQRRGEASSLRTTSPIAPVAAVSAGQTVVPPAVGVSATVPSQHASTAGVVASLPAASSPPSNLRPSEVIIGSTGGAQPAPQAALNTEAGAAPTKRTASGKARRRRVRAPGVSTVYERRYVPLFYACTLHAAGLTRWLGCMRRSGDVHA